MGPHTKPSSLSMYSHYSFEVAKEQMELMRETLKNSINCVYYFRSNSYITRKLQRPVLDPVNLEEL